MIKRLTIGNRRITLTYAKIAKVIGVNSNVGDRGHITMWDFDNIPLADVTEALETVKTRYLLSDIHIVRTKEPNNYHAFCFSLVDWRTSVEIVAQTRFVDWQFFRFGVYRGHWTLRTTPKTTIKAYLVSRIQGLTLPDIKPEELESWVRYETLNWR